jgi:hypothetical protein
MKPYVIDRKVMLNCIVMVMVAGLLVGAAAMAVGYRVKEVEPAMQKVALSVCPMPQTEGEMTVYVVENGKIKCWRWK